MTNALVPPPPVLDSARVMAYAFVQDIPYRRWGALYVGGELLEHVSRLAICINLGEDIGPMLFHCDEQWHVLGAWGGEAIKDVKDRAEKNYPGVMSRWVEVNTSIEDALRYYDQQTGGLKCSFCGKRPFEIEGGLIEGKQAVICKECVEMYHRELNEHEPSNRREKQCSDAY